MAACPPMVRGVQVLIAVTALMGLAACGSVTAGGAAPPASTTSSAPSSSQPPATVASTQAAGSLCADGQTAADRVVVSGSAAPRQVTVHGATQVRAMVAALCALPAMPAGQNCPAASGASVQLVFAAGTQSFPPVSVQESGCRGVTGVGATRSWSPSSAFGQMLSEAVGGVGKLVPGYHPSSVPTGP